MLKEFKSFVEKHNLIGRYDRVLLALSGGVDSMVLAKLLLLSHRDTETPRHQGLVSEPVEVPTAKSQQPTANIQQTLSTTQQLSNSATQQLNLVTEPVEVPTANSQRTTDNRLRSQLSNSATQQLSNSIWSLSLSKCQRFKVQSSEFRVQSLSLIVTSICEERILIVMRSL